MMRYSSDARHVRDGMNVRDARNGDDVVKVIF
jgi:hypothetical protein